MKNKKLLKTAYIATTMVALALSLSTATYAWFTTNSVTSTDLATGHSNTEKVELQLSSTGGSNFQGGATANIVRVNSEFEGSSLLPVSTLDLKNFVYSPSTVDGMAEHFVKAKEGERVYHGRIYLKAAVIGNLTGKMALYLDEDESNGGKLLGSSKAYGMNAVRIGIVVEGENPLILRYSEASNPEGGHFYNTVIDGQLIESNIVLTMDGDETVKAHQDPSKYYGDYVIPANGVATGNVTPLANLNLNQVYAVDVYIYIEGCDPDCTETIEYDELNFHLGFYGVLIEEVS